MTEIILAASCGAWGKTVLTFATVSGSDCATWLPVAEMDEGHREERSTRR